MEDTQEREMDLATPRTHAEELQMEAIDDGFEWASDLTSTDLRTEL